MKKQKKRILLVDDNIDILEAVSLLLEDVGYDVITDNGEKVESLKDSDLPDIILMDMLLSGKDGRDIIRFFKSQKRTQHIPIILISAHPQAKIVWKDSMADDFLAKPFGIDELQRLMRKHLSLHP